jgi:hypothetical protein
VTPPPPPDTPGQPPAGPTAWGVRDLLRPQVLLDTVAPTVVFAALAGRGVGVAAAAALGLSAAVVAWRLVRRQRLLHAASGAGGVAVGVVVALASGEAEGFFLPGIVSNVAFGALSAVSCLVRRPAIAYTSALLYRWPIGWYLHPRVRPAYTEVTWVWAAYYLAKGGWQAALVAGDDLGALAVVRVVTGWPALVALLVATYAYVRWRLDRLGGPDVEEWRAQAAGAP